KNTSAQVESAYLVGEAKRKAAEEAARQAEIRRQQELAAQQQQQQQHQNQGGGGGGSSVPPPNGNVVQTAINYAKAQLGKPYIFGGEGPGGYDCSGLTMKAYAYAGVYIGSHSVNNQWYT
ncbi:C40 family peptidase, partial [Pedococcus sp. 2YAF34]|uniref:C40 family peptidase n=1 Tax=Pedococcus sp. 2YAF34 TaxID=3233032 RepID=UPI003F98F987